MSTDQKPSPNEKLRQARETKCWSQQDVADHLYDLCLGDDPTWKTIITADQVGRWERGVKPALKYQTKLCSLFGKTPEELGFVTSSAPTTSLMSPVHTQSLPSPPPLPIAPTIIYVSPQVQAIDTLISTGHRGLYSSVISQNGIDNAAFSAYAHTEREQQLSEWLLLGVGNIAPLLDNGWSLEDVLQSIQILMKVVQAMPKISRQQFLNSLLGFGAAAFLGNIPDFSTKKHVAEEDRAKLHQALSNSVIDAWKLFQTAGNAQVLAIGQAQLHLLQRTSSLFPSDVVGPFLYSPVYRLIGAALHFQGNYDKAYQTHQQAYLTALEGADAWNMAQSRMWQADALKMQEQFGEALQALEAAIRLVSTQKSAESVRTKAHILASAAECAARMGDEEGVRSRLTTSEELLEGFPGPHEEFDTASLHQIAGVCAIHLGHYDIAINRLRQAFEAQSSQRVLSKVLTCMPLVMAYACAGEKDISLETIEQSLPLIHLINAPSINKQFVDYTTYALSNSFPKDQHIRAFLNDMQHQLVATNSATL